MHTREKCAELVAKWYAHVLLRDRALNEGIEGRLGKDSRILDAGCGIDAPIAARHAPKTGFCAGVDMVERYTPPPGVSIVRADLNALPFRDRAFDLVFSRSVLEHLENPRLTLQEVARVVKPGGRIVMVTPNKYDYASMIARIVPNRLHGFFLRKVAGEDVYDDFPTYFRCNTRRAVENAVRASGLRLEKFLYLRHYPYYLMFSRLLFYLGMAYDRAITRLNLGFLQPSIYLELEKPGDT